MILQLYIDYHDVLALYYSYYDSTTKLIVTTTEPLLLVHTQISRMVNSRICKFW